MLYGKQRWRCCVGCVVRLDEIRLEMKILQSSDNTYMVEKDGGK